MDVWARGQASHQRHRQDEPRPARTQAVCQAKSPNRNQHLDRARDREVPDPRRKRLRLVLGDGARKVEALLISGHPTAT